MTTKTLFAFNNDLIKIRDGIEDMYNNICSKMIKCIDCPFNQKDTCLKTEINMIYTRMADIIGNTRPKD